MCKINFLSLVVYELKPFKFAVSILPLCHKFVQEKKTQHQSLY